MVLTQVVNFIYTSCDLFRMLYVAFATRRFCLLSYFAIWLDPTPQVAESSQPLASTVSSWVGPCVAPIPSWRPTCTALLISCPGAAGGLYHCLCTRSSEYSLLSPRFLEIDQTELMSTLSNAAWNRRKSSFRLVCTHRAVPISVVPRSFEPGSLYSAWSQLDSPYRR